jgi:hypothetical protein
MANDTGFSRPYRSTDRPPRVSSLLLLYVLAACEPSRAPEAPQSEGARDGGGRRELDAGRAALDAARPETPPRDARVPDAREASMQAPSLDDAVTHYEIEWIREQSDAGFVARAQVLIAAPLQEVWSLVRDVNSYHAWSKTLTAEAEPVAPGASINLHIQLLDPPLPRTDSVELIAIVDDLRHAISWGGDFGDGETSTRFQIVEPADGRVRWITGLRFTPTLGSLTLAALGENLQRAFDQVGAELKAEAESRTRP